MQEEGGRGYFPWGTMIILAFVRCFRPKKLDEKIWVCPTIGQIPQAYSNWHSVSCEKCGSMGSLPGDNPRYQLVSPLFTFKETWVAEDFRRFKHQKQKTLCRKGFI
jgi:hypothetical protein